MPVQSPVTQSSGRTPQSPALAILISSFAFLVLTSNASAFVQAEQNDAPVIRLRGNVVPPAGLDRRDLTCELVESLDRPFDFEVTPIELRDDLTFETRTRGLANRTAIIARTQDKKWRGIWLCSKFELHSKSTNEIELKLVPVVLRAVQVTHDSKPQAGAIVFVSDVLSIEPMTTDQDGIVWFDSSRDGKKSALLAATAQDGLASPLEYGAFPIDGTPYPLALKQWERDPVQVVGADGKPVADIVIASCSIGSEKRNTNILLRSFWSRSGPDGMTAPILVSDERMQFEVLSPNMRVVSFDKSTIPHRVVVAPVQPNVQVRGKLSLPDGIGAGLLLSGLSFQNEAPHRSSMFECRLNSDGSFVASVHPEYTYCVYVLDATWVSAPWTGIMSSPRPDEAKPISLDIVEGEAVELLITRGKDVGPASGVWVTFRQPKQFSWREDGVLKHGSGGPAWGVYTDEEGIASIAACQGEIVVYASEDTWRDELKATVRSGITTVLSMHRDEPESIAFAGQVKFADIVEPRSPLSQVSIDLYLYDVYDPIAKLVVDDDGKFHGNATKPRIALLARTKDQKFSGVRVVDLESNQETPLKIELRPSVSLSGRILDPDGFALADTGMEFGTRPRILWPKKEPFGSDIFHTKNIFMNTDKQGRYFFPDVCSDVPSAMFAIFRGADATTVLYEHSLESPTAFIPTVVMPEAAMSSRSIEARIKNRIESSRLLNSNAILVYHGSDKSAVEMAIGMFSRGNFKGTRDLSHLVISESTIKGDPSSAAWLKEQGWSLSNDQELLLVLFDQAGKPIVSKRIQATDNITSISEVIERKQLQLIEQSWDSQSRFESELALAQRTDRDVWISFVSIRNPASIALLRWQEEHRKELEKHFVLMRVDWIRDENIGPIADRYSVVNNGEAGLASVLVNKEGIFLHDTSGDSPYKRMSSSQFIDRERIGALMKAASHPMDPSEWKALFDSL
jgi:hypothetical protein